MQTIKVNIEKTANGYEFTNGNTSVASKPIYSLISSCGDRMEISAEDFNNRLNAILNA